jgi:hypothetical protein
MRSKTRAWRTPLAKVSSVGSKEKEGNMALFDKVKEQASQLAQKAQEAGKAGQAKIEDAQAKRKSDAMLRDLGAALYAQKTTGADNGAEIDRIVSELTAFEAEHGPVAADDASDAPDASGSTPSAGTSSEAEPPPEGGFKL